MEGLISNCTLANNTAGGRGGGIAHVGSTADLNMHNSLLWGNAAAEGPQLAVLFVQSRGSATARVSHCNVEGGPGAVFVESGSTLDWGQGNIDAAPLFRDAAVGDFHLGAGSPAIDAADADRLALDRADLDGDGNTQEPTPWDLDAQSRFVDDPATADTGRGDPAWLDIGAFEFSGCFGCAADIDGDGNANSNDFFAYLGLFAAGDPCADIDFDGALNTNDFFAYLAALQQGCP